MSDLETEFWEVFYVTERDQKGSVVAGFLMKLVLFAVALLVVFVCVSQTSLITNATVL